MSDATRARHVNRDGTIGGWVDATARVAKTATVDPDAQVLGLARVYEKARIREDAVVGGLAKVGGRAVVGGQARVNGRARVGDDAVVVGDTELVGVERICGHGHLESSRDVFTCTASTDEPPYTWTVHRAAEGGWVINCGCEASIDAAGTIDLHNPAYGPPEWLTERTLALDWCRAMIVERDRQAEQS